MAEVNETIPSFSIQDTMEMGSGNREALESFLSSSESATASPDKIEPIKKEPPKKEDKPEPKKKEEPTKKEVDTDKTINKFLDGNEDPENEEVDENEEGEEGDGNEAEKSSNNFNALSKDLFKLGVFTKEEEEGEVEINTPEELLERFNQEKRKGALESINNFIGQFGEDYQKAFEAIYVKGVDPKEYFGTYNEIENLASLDLKTEANQITVVRQYLADQGFEPEDLAAELERIKNYGDLENIATRHHKVLLKRETTKLAEKERESQQRLQQQASIKNAYINNVNTVLEKKLQAKEFDGIPLNPKLASELQDFLLTEKYKTPSGETLTEFDRTILELKRPENHEKKVKIGLLLKVLEKDPTLSTIQRTGLSKKSDTLFNELSRQSEKSSVKTQQKTSKPSSWFNQ